MRKSSGWIFWGLLGVLAGASVHAAKGTSYLNVDLVQERYLGEVQNSSQVPNYTVLSGDLNLEARSAGFFYKFNPVGEGAIEVPDEFYFGVPEAYIRARNLAPGFNMGIGRMKRTWSRLDEEFSLGVWQPQLRWDYLAPRQEGLIGIHLEWALSDNFQFTFFTSPLFLPDQGPNYKLTDGHFTSSNRWFVPPQTSLNLLRGSGLSKDVPIYFQLDRPSEEAIIMHSSFGLGLMYHPSASFWVQANYAYKPLNQIHLGVDCPNCGNLSGVTPLEVNPVIHPVVVNHHVATLETGFDRVDDRGYVSLTGDFPSNSGFPDSYYESPLDSMMIAGAAYQHYIFSWLGVPSWLKYSYMKTFLLRSKDKHGLVDTEQVQSSLDRYPYREVAAVEWKMLLRQEHKNRLELKTRYSYSVSEKGGWLSSGVGWSVGDLTWNLGLDVLGSDVSENSPSAGLFTRYRSNDRVYGGINYVY